MGPNWPHFNCPDCHHREQAAKRRSVHPSLPLAALRAAMGCLRHPIFDGLASDMARMGLKRLILSILAAWRQIWPEWASGSSFWAFWAAWHQIWPEWASGGSFRAFWWPGARYGQNEPQEVHFEHFGRPGARYGQNGPQEARLEHFGRILRALGRRWAGNLVFYGVQGQAGPKTSKPRPKTTKPSPKTSKPSRWE